METSVLLVIRKFPRQDAEIRRRALADPAFRSLCDDLRDAEEALHRWRQTASGDAPARESEYRLLVSELADEIAQALRR